MPRTRTRLPAWWIAARMYWRCPVRVTVSMKSIARIASPWERRKSAHVMVVRCGAVDAIGFEDLPHRGGSDPDAERGEFAVDAPVGP